METKKVEIEEIKINDSPQVRITNDANVIADYAAHLAAGGTFPPVVLFGNEGQYYLADGFHRLEAAKTADQDMIDAEVHPGDRKAALKFALSANAKHGLRRSNPDKRHAIQIALAEFPGLSNHAYEEMCRVSDDLVKKVKGEVQAEKEAELKQKSRKEEKNSPLTDTLAKGPEKVIGKDKKEYPATRTGIPAKEWISAVRTPKPPISSVTVTTTSLEEVVTEIRGIAMTVAPDHGHRLAEALRRLADEVDSKEVEVVTVE